MIWRGLNGTEVIWTGLNVAEGGIWTGLDVAEGGIWTGLDGVGVMMTEAEGFLTETGFFGESEARFAVELGLPVALEIPVLLAEISRKITSYSK